MAEGQQVQDPVAQAFVNLRLELASVSQALAAQGISTSVPKFDGSPKPYSEWIRAVEKYATLIGANFDARKKLIAFQSALGAVSSFIQRYMIANPDGSWAKLKTQPAFR